MRISEQHLKHWREYGYAVVDDFLTSEELAAAQSELSRTFPSREEYAYGNARGGEMRELPFLGDTLNFMAVHPEIVSFVERALGTPRIALAQSIAWAKYPGLDDFNMPLHVDYMNTSMLYPNPQEPYEEVTLILYYVDVDQQLGATYVVSNQYSRDEVLVPYLRDKTQYPDLYRHEQPVCVRAGSLLIYNMATFHRASGITAKDRTRFSHHIVYRSEDAPWVGYRVWANYGLSPEMQRFIEQASPRQRELLGFPPPSCTYWNEETLTGIAARYPGMDMIPYLEAVDLPNEQRERLRESLGQSRSRDIGSAGATDLMGERAAQSGEQLPMNLAYNYYPGIANYYAGVTGVPADYWLSWLTTYYGLNTGAQRELAYNYCRGMADYYALVTGIPADYWLSSFTTYYGLDADARARM
jgi:ectoine hydroxylase-related dioxygenase (phytanoyl-CoA dioxygenase family)